MGLSHLHRAPTARGAPRQENTNGPKIPHNFSGRANLFHRCPHVRRAARAHRVAATQYMSGSVLAAFSALTSNDERERLRAAESIVAQLKAAQDATAGAEQCRMTSNRELKYILNIFCSQLVDLAALKCVGAAQLGSLARRGNIWRCGVRSQPSNPRPGIDAQGRAPGIRRRADMSVAAAQQQFAL